MKYVLFIICLSFNLNNLCLESEVMVSGSLTDFTEFNNLQEKVDRLSSRLDNLNQDFDQADYDGIQRDLGSLKVEIRNLRNIQDALGKRIVKMEDNCIQNSQQDYNIDNEQDSIKQKKYNLLSIFSCCKKKRKEVRIN